MCCGVVERGGEAEFVEDDQVDAEQGFDDLADGVVGKAAVEGFHEVGGGEVADLVPGMDRGDSQADQGVGLAGSSGPMIARFCCARIHSRLDRLANTFG